jgi:hypothetical protein
MSIEGGKSAATQRYAAMGLCVESDFVLPWVPLAAARRPVDVEFVRGRRFPSPQPNARHIGSKSGKLGAIHGFEDCSGLHALVHGVGRYWIRPGGETVTYVLNEDVDLADAQHWFCSLVLGVASLQQRRIVLHASGVVVADRGVAFVGNGGTGKTTLAASFGREGQPLLSEDALPVRIAPDTVHAVPFLPGIRLWRESIDRLAGSERHYQRALSWLDKERIPVGGEWGAVCCDEVPLRVIYDLSPAEGHEGIDITETTGVAKVMRLVSSVYFANALSAEGQVGLVEDAERLGRFVRLRRLTYSRTFEALPALRAAILCDLDAVGRGLA